MARVAGITIEKSPLGKPLFMRIDLRKYGKNSLIEDFYDIFLAEQRKNEETIPLEEVIKHQNKKRGIK